MFYTKCTCADAYVFTCTAKARVRCKFPRISCFRHHQLRYQACASAFIPSVVGLHLSFPLFVIIPMLSLAQAVWTSFEAKFTHVSVISRCFLNVHSTYELFPLHKQETLICLLQLYMNGVVEAHAMATNFL